MRAVVWVVLIAAAAVGLTLAARYNAGYVLLVLPPYRVELSLNLLILLALGGFAAAYALARLVVHVLRLPGEVRAYRARRLLARAEASLAQALRAFFEGRYGAAEQAAARAIESAPHAGMAAIVAARSAHALRAFDRRDSYLARNASFGADDAVMRAMARAELALEAGDHEQAIGVLGALGRRHTAALRLELRAAQQAHRWERVVELADELRRSGALDATVCAELARHAASERLRRQATDVDSLRAAWNSTSAAQRRDPRVAATAARAFLSFGSKREAAEAIEAALGETWDSELAGLYGECAHEGALAQIQRAEGWLAREPNDPAVLMTLGRLCAHQQLWGKAQSYLEASIALDSGFNAHLTLAELLERIDRPEEARGHYRKSLDLAIAALRSASGGRRRSAQ